MLHATVIATRRYALATGSWLRRGHGARALGLLACALLAGCRAQAPSVLLFDCRVPVADAQQRLAAEHGSMDLIRTPRQRADFLQFTSGKRYAFVVRRDGVLAVSPLPADAGRNPYSPAVLASGDPVVTAGGITIVHANDEVLKLVIDSDSAAYCPTSDSVREALPILARAGIPGDRIRYENRPRTCVDQPPVSAPSMSGMPGTRDYSDVMVEMDRRFKLAGAAIAAKHGDLADYELFGLLRGVRDDLPQARPPETAKIDRLNPFARTFIDTDFPYVRQAVWDADWPRAREGFARMAATCNHCHAAGNVAFLEVDARPEATTLSGQPAVR